MKEAAPHIANAPPQKQPFFNQDREGQFFDTAKTNGQPKDAFFSATGIQPKLEVGSRDDHFEKQADHTADKVVQKLSKPDAHTPAVQTKSQSPKEEELQKKDKEEPESQEKKIQKKPVFESDEISEKTPKVQKKDEVIMRKSDADASAPPSSVEKGLSSAKGGGAPMDSGTKDSMESAFGADFSKVRIHNDSSAKKMNNDLGAQAFAHGNDIYFNEGKYDPQSSSGKHLLAHELTHTIQQGGGVKKKDKDEKAEDVPSVQKQMIQKADAPAAAGPAAASNETVDISSGQFNPSEKLKGEIEAAKHKGLDVNISASKIGGGTVTTKITGKKGQYDSLNNNYFKIPVSIPYLAAANPTLHVKINNNVATGEVGTAKSRSDLDNWIAKNTEALGWFGIKVPSLKSKFTNKFENGVLNLGISGVTVTIAEFVTATLSAGFQDLQKPVVNIAATVKAKGMAEGSLAISNEKGPLQGSVDIAVNFASFSGNVTATYKPDGNIDIKGSVGYTSDKLSGSLTLVATDKKTADNFALTQLGGGEAKDASIPEEVPAAAGKGERGLAGMGTLTFALTEWFAGSVTAIVDGQGGVTVVGKIAPPKEIELFPQKDFDKELFKFEARAAYGIPVVGNVFVFANIALKALAKVGPAKIYNIEIDGTYSTRSDIAKSITIAGSLNISAYAGLRLRAEGGVGLTVLGHDIKLGVGVNADAGVKGYVDARPVIGYRDPGEFFFKGHMEIAAQPFLGLSGDLFVELDSPWWSPAPDKKWTWPIGSLEYPLPGQFGIGADMEYVLGSGKTPEISFGKADFDGGKFMTDLVDKQVPSGGGKGTQNKPGTFTDGGAAAPKPAPDAKGADKGKPGDKKAPGKGGGKKDKKGKDADKNDELKQMDAAMKKVKALESGKALGRTEIAAAINKIKQEHKVQIAFKEKGSDAWEVTLSAKGKGSKQPAKVKRKKEDDKNPQNADPKKQAKLDAGIKALKDEDKRIAGDGKMKKDEAQKVAANIQGTHGDVFKSISIKEKGNHWGYHYVQRQPAQGDVIGAEVVTSKLAAGLKIGDLIHYNNDKPDLIYKIHSVDNKLDIVFLVAEDGKGRKEFLENFNKGLGSAFTLAKKDESVPTIPVENVGFFYRKHHDAGEYQRQLDLQSSAICSMTVDNWIKNRSRFEKEGRDASSAKEQEDHRAHIRNRYVQVMLPDLYKKYFAEFSKTMKADVADFKATDKAGKEAEIMADKYMEDKAALHGPDQVAGGDAGGLQGLGTLSINSSIGSQWKNKAPDLKAKVEHQKQLLVKAGKKTDKVKMNVTITKSLNPKDV